MTQYIQYLEGNMHSEPYSAKYDDEDDDDDFDDDEDGYDGLTDFDDEDETSHGLHRCASAERNGSVGNEYRRQRSESESSATQLDLGDDNRRDHHNQLERKRRASIKISYNELREAIPNLRDSKASRAVILQRAVEYIEELLKLKRDHTYCVDTLRRENDAVLQALQHLIQCIESEEATSTTTTAAVVSSSVTTTLSSSVSSSGGGGASVAPGSGTTTLRLVSGPLSSTSAGGMAVNTAGLPVYRLLKQSQPVEPSGHGRATTKAQPSCSSSTRCLSSTTVVTGAGAHHVQLLPRTTANPTSLHLMMTVPSSSSSTSSSSSSSPHLHTPAYPFGGGVSNVKHGLGTLSAAATLVANSSHSYPSSMLVEAVQSRSQRSSPCGPSSSASSSSSSSLSSVPSRQTSCYTSSTTPTITTAGNTTNGSNCDDDDDVEEDGADDNEEESALSIETLAAARAYEDTPSVSGSISSVGQLPISGNSRRSAATKPPTLLTISSTRSPVVVTRSTIRPISVTTNGPVALKRNVLTESSTPKLVRRSREPAASDASLDIVKCRRFH